MTPAVKCACTVKHERLTLIRNACNSSSSSNNSGSSSSRYKCCAQACLNLWEWCCEETLVPTAVISTFGRARALAFSWYSDVNWPSERPVLYTSTLLRRTALSSQNCVNLLVMLSASTPLPTIVPSKSLTCTAVWHLQHSKKYN